MLPSGDTWELVYIYIYILTVGVPFKERCKLARGSTEVMTAQPSEPHEVLTHQRQHDPRYQADRPALHACPWKSHGGPRRWSKQAVRPADRPTRPPQEVKAG